LFTKDNILKAFNITGLYLLNCNKVLKRFPKGAANLLTPLPPPLGITARSLMSELDAVVADKSLEEARALY
jgi:hypothetical protein